MSVSKVSKIVRYITEDGSEFERKNQAAAYQNVCDLQNEIRKAGRLYGKHIFDRVCFSTEMLIVPFNVATWPEWRQGDEITTMKDAAGETREELPNIKSKFEKIRKACERRHEQGEPQPSPPNDNVY